MAHTPGPWDVDSVMSEAMHDICMAQPPPGEGNPVVLASVYYDEDRGTCPTLQEANANAHLIAAAPDLLAALEAIRSEESLHLDWSDDEWLPDSLRLAKSALAKAKGEPK